MEPRPIIELHTFWVSTSDQLMICLLFSNIPRLVVVYIVGDSLDGMQLDMGLFEELHIFWVSTSDQLLICLLFQQYCVICHRLIYIVGREGGSSS